MADDTTPPTLTITRIGGEFAEVGAPVRFALTFSEPVTGVTAAALRLNASVTLAGAAITSVSGSGADYVVTVGPVTAGYGAVTLELVAGGIGDLAGNALRLGQEFVAKVIPRYSGAAPGGSAIADINGDGRSDYVQSTLDSRVIVYLANPDGSLSERSTNVAIGSNGTVDIADVNGDGKPDILVGNQSNVVYVFKGNGDGTFAENIPAFIGPPPIKSPNAAYFRKAIGDIDGDGKSDIVTDKSSFTGSPTMVSVLRGNGDGTFAPEIKTDLGFVPSFSPYLFVLADFNRDGKQDLITAQNASVITLMFGKNDGTFSIGLPVTVSGSIRSVNIADLNGDNIPDVLITDINNQRITGLINNGDGTFSQRISQIYGSPVSIVDYDRDGRIDVVVDEGESFLQGNGDGTFGARTSINRPVGALFFKTDDFNGDGSLDFFGFTPEKGDTIFVSSSNSRSGPVTTIDDFAGDASTSGRIAPGNSVVGFINSAADKDWFRADFDAGQTYVFDLQAYGSGGGSLNNARLTLRNAAGDILGYNFSASELQEPQITVTPTTSATYFLEATSSFSGGGSGTYRLSAKRLATKQADFSDAADIVTLRSPIAAVPVQVWSALGGNDDVTGGKLTSDTINGNAGNDTLSGGDVGLTLAGEGVFQAYQLFGRAPDAGGFEYMVRIAGFQVGAISAAFVDQSAEFAAMYGGLNNAGFITKLYTIALGRIPTATELAGWEARFTEPASRGTVASEFVGLPELDTRTEYVQAEFAASLDKANFGALHRLYATAFGRAPELGGFSDWTGKRDAGQTIGDVALGFANSDEFGAATKDLTNAQIVTKLYQNALGRAPDAGGLADWVSQLNAGPKTGALLAKVLLGFSESAEFKALQPTAPAAFVSTVLTQWTDVLDGGAGDDVLIGGRGADTFRFLKGETGSDRIIAFESWDKLAFTNFGYASGADALARMAQVGADVVFADQGSSITFVNTTLATVSAANFNVGEII